MLFVFQLIYHSICQKPIFLVPGLLGSILHGSVTEKKRWYCPTFQDQDVWINKMLTVPPVFNCLFDFVGLQWNNNTNEPEQVKDVNLSIVDFGGLNGVSFFDTPLLGMSFVPYYKPLINKLKTQFQYEERIDLFGIPFDWRFGVHQKSDYFEKIRQQVEDAFYLNHNEKAIMIGHSMGCYLLDVFLMNYTTAEWRNKFVDKVILLAPSFGGSFSAFYSLWTKRPPVVSILGTFPDTIGTMGGIHAHMPNYDIFENDILLIEKDGQPKYAKDLVEVLIENGKINHDMNKILGVHEKWFSQKPSPIDLPVKIVYNSGLKTPKILNLTNDKEEIINGKGDGIVNAEGPEYVCSYWNDIECLDLNSNGLIGSDHISMLYSDKTLNFILEQIDETLI
ncbi:Lecithin:cholesterol acyltransferase family protein [Tritrichomonas foetus]|uniref:Lecithin:cholesterol acyltransferase family protein n=1 Tax=Tritrichomonas foetus TaxID=1144522 RepID=A0A1J4JFR2_9EUKA|nr:Lecithin:cholesterol acyltransferase family protein [Tritrichomonas foetus]|eukprot:OHS97497.1 Lecithin:cholesterol acyltransferase family protein [Tritrichomonas foetus]